MTITPKEALGYLALEESIGKLDMDPMEIDESSTDLYEKNARAYAANALYYFSAYRLSLDPDLPAQKQAVIQKRMEEERIKAENRDHEKRESQVMSLLSGLTPRATKLPDSAVLLETTDGVFCLSVTDYDGQVFVLRYDRQTYMLDGHLLNEPFAEEDWKALNGSSTPMAQSKAYAAVSKYLDEAGQKVSA